MQLNGQEYRRMLDDKIDDEYELRRLDASENDKDLSFKTNFEEWLLIW